MSRTVVRLFLLIVYVVLSYHFSLSFIRSDGLGSYAPLAILFSWGILPGEFNWVPKPVGFWMIPLCYLLSLMAVVSAWTRTSWRAFSLFPILVHFVGAMVALRLVTRLADHGADATIGFMVASYLTATVLAAAYLFSDRRLAKKV